MESIKAIVCRVGAAPVVEQCTNELAAWQALVGGYIEVVHLDDGVYMICNEEGTFGEPFNRIVPGRAPHIPEGYDFVIEPPGGRPAPGEFGEHQVHGNFALVRDTSDGSFDSLTDRDVMLWLPVLLRTGEAGK